jgi:integrase
MATLRMGQESPSLRARGSSGPSVLRTALPRRRARCTHARGGPASRSNYKRSFETVCSKVGVACPFYDTRHTFITKLAENSRVSEESIRQLASHVSKEILKRHAHVRDVARRDAVATSEGADTENLVQKIVTVRRCN